MIIGSTKTLWTSAKLIGCQFLFQLQDEYHNVLKHACYIIHYNIPDSNHKNNTFISTNDSHFINTSKLSCQLGSYQGDHCMSCDEPNEVLDQCMFCIKCVLY
jgi:hypothetical protein